MHYDVIIVGAGPAGAGVALEFAGSDLRVLLLEKESLPRKKPCGGAMPSSVEKLLNVDISKVVKNRTMVQKLYHNYENEVVKKVSSANTPILINRSEFDMFLLEQARAVGSGNLEIMDKCRVVSVDESFDKVNVVLENGKTLESKYLIAADGALGKIASGIGLMQKRKFAPSLDAEITTSAKYYDEHCDTMVMNYFCVPHGYGWIFPKEKNRFSCGVLTWGKALNLKKELNDFIARSFPKESIESIEVLGYPIPIYQGSQQISTQRILLAGDAAALVDPVSGEGIRFALHSGKISAIVIMEALKGDTDLLSDSISQKYQKVINEEIGKELKTRLTFASLAFHNNPDMFYNVFVK
ncbi:MAG: geranylgeranyl reductase family protein [Sulfurovaceae bacterium]|nr:geranylgeranyl reductase family protein [Sulfurovaceae bacterium]